MKRILAILLAACLCVGSVGCGARVQKYTAYSFDYFDTATSIVGYADSQAAFDAAVAEIKQQLGEYHQLYNIYQRYDGVTNLAAINARAAGDGTVSVDGRLADMLAFAAEMHTLTGGKTNVAMGSVLSIWHTYRERGIDDPTTAQLPPMAELTAAAGHTAITDMVVDTDADTVYLADDMLTLDVGAVAKGYAVERVAQWMAAEGYDGWVLNVGGNVRTVGGKPTGEDWLVGIENPNTDSDEPYIAYLELRDKALVTSGNYQRYYLVDGVRYHHIIDPVTLMPSDRYRSVSVVCSDSGVADALSTALFCMDYDTGVALVDSLTDAEAMWVMPDGTQRYSDGFTAYLQQK